MGRRLVAGIALICFSGCLPACSWTATIARTDALDNESEIEHSDADALYLLARNGTVHRVPRQSVGGIDHPGNVEMIVGAILLGFGIAIAVDEWNKDRDDAKMVGAVYGVPGLTLLLTGGVRYIMSLRAAWAFQTADEPAPPLPMPMSYPPPLPRAAPPPPAPAPPAPAPSPSPTTPPAPEDEQPQVTPGGAT